MARKSSICMSIVFLNFNRVEETRYTVSILLSLFGARDDVEIIAVDNGSSDGTREYLEQQKEIITVLLDDNNGIAGYNHGFRKASGDYIFVLDDDSCPHSHTVVDDLLAVFHNNPKVGLVACHIENPDTTPQWSWHLPREKKEGLSPFFIGCGFAIRRDLFSDIGWYPASFFLYQNEIDVAFKVRIAGYDIFYAPSCRVVHRTQPSSRPSERRIFYPTRNTIWLIRSYYPLPSSLYMTFSRLLIGLLRAIYFRELPAYCRAVKEAFSVSVDRADVDKSVLKSSLPFWRQNSIIHHLFKVT